VLIDAKRFDTTESTPKIIRQLQRYHTAAQEFGFSGLDLLRAYARRKPHPDQPPLSRVSAQRVCSPTARLVIDRATAWGQLCTAPKITANEIAVFVALNGPPKLRLCRLLDELYASTGLSIGVIVTDVSGKRREVVGVAWPTDKGGLVAFRAAIAPGWPVNDTKH
jgi:hypothetical protein